MSMDADSSYGGSDTAQDSTLGHDNNSLETSNARDEVDKSVMSSNDANTYFKNEVTLPINYNEGEEKPSSLPHYLSTAKLNIEESVDAQQLDDLSSSTLNLNSESPKSKKSGIDNPAYEEDGKINAPPSNGALKSTFDENKTYTNGDLNTSPTLPFSSPGKNEEQMAEAVNLELINLKPVGKDVVGGYGGSNGINDIPIKKETEVEIGNPYDEYFVPVNEHRKYMRGEKLYVTKDKRDKKTRNKCLCWSICLVFVTAAVIVGILAAVGIIGNQEAQPVQGARQFSDSTDSDKTKVKSAGGLFGIGDTTEEPPPINNYPPTSEPTIITMPNHPPTTDTSKIEVPRALESQLIIDNLQFTEELAHRNSSKFKNLAENIERQLLEALFADEDVVNRKAKINLKVMEFTPGSVVVKYRISWTFEDENEAKDPIDKELLNKKLMEMLDENYGFLENYHIPESTIATAKIINMCQIDNNGCEHACIFDYVNNDFQCKCPDNMQLNTDHKTCINIPIAEPSSTTEPDPVTDFVFEQTHVHHHEQGRSNDANIYAEPEPEPEFNPTSQPPDHLHMDHGFQQFSVEPHEHSHNEHESHTTTPAQPEPTPIAEVDHQLNTQHDLDSSHEYDPFSVELEPTIKAEHDVHLHHTYYGNESEDNESDHILKLTTTPHTNTQEDEHIISHHYDDFSAVPEPTAKPEPEYENKETTQSTTTHHSDTQLTVIPEPEPEIDEHSSEPEHHSMDADVTTKPESNLQDEQLIHVHMVSAVSENVILEPEPTVQPEPEHTVQPEPEPTVQPEPAPTIPEPEPTVQPEPEPTVQPEPEPNLPAHTTSPVQTMQLEHFTMKTDSSQRNESTEITEHTQSEMHVQVLHQENSWNSTSEMPITDQPKSVPAVMFDLHQESQTDANLILETTPFPTSSTTSEAVMEKSNHTYFNTAIEQVGMELQHDSSSTSVPQPTIKMEDMEMNSMNITSQKSNQYHIAETSSEVSSMISTIKMELTTEHLQEQTPTMPNEKELNEHLSANEIPATTEIINQIENKSIEETSMSSANESMEEESSTKPSENYIPNTAMTREGKLSEGVIPLETTTHLEMNTATTLKQNDMSEHEHVLPDMTTVSSINMEHKIKGAETFAQNNDVLDVTHMQTDEMTTQRIVPVAVISHMDSTEHTKSQPIKEHVTEKGMEMDSTENVHNFDNMSPFLPDIDNDTLVNILHSEVDGFTEQLHHINESEIYTSSEIPPPRLDMDEMNQTNPQDRHPSDAVLSVLPLDDNDTLNSNEIVNKIEHVPIMKPIKIENMEVNETQTVLPKSSTKTVVTLSPDIINNVHSNNYFLKLQTSTEAEYYTEPLPHKESEEKISQNNVSTEDLIAQETTTNKLQETTVKNVTTNLVDMAQSVTEKVYVIDDRVENSSEVVYTTHMPIERKDTLLEPSTEAHQYQVHENLSEDVTTTRTFRLSTTETATLSPLQQSSALPSVIPLSDEQENSKEEGRKIDDDSLNKLGPVESIYDPRELLNDINDDGKFENKGMKKVESTTEVVEESTDYAGQAPFTSPPHYSTESDEENDFYLQNIKNATMMFDVKPVTEGFTISHFSRCASGQYQCVNGTAIKGGTYCISDNDRCDSVDDCTDASDEVGCVEEKCLQNFQCKNGQCLKRRLVCNGISDCTDGSDEVDCESWKCIFDEFSCGEGNRCIPLSLRCDGRKDCPKGDDEHSCYSQQCQSDEYRCSDKETCIPASWRCDGERDCMEGDDEHFCDCAFDQFKCVKGGGCIPNNQMCDGIEQCPDFSDEWNCFRMQETMDHTNYLEVRPQNMSWLQVCGLQWNSSYSEMVCQSLGFAGSSSTELIKLKEISTAGYYKVKKLQSNYPLLTRLEQTTDCDSVVSITCQDFECGSHTSSDTPSARIIGGDRASETQWPGVVLLYNKKHHIQCTSTVIAPNWVLASYSCIFAEKYLHGEVKEWVLYAGGTNLSVHINNGTQLRLVRKIIPHPQAKYSEMVYSNDIVLMQLDTPLQLGPNISAICLPNVEIEPRQLCVTAGWGVKTPGEPGRQEYLHYLPVPTLDTSQCNSTEHYNGRLTKDKICAGYTDSDRTPCYNDEGAPLLCFSEASNTWELQGILSHHANCGRNRHPALYTSISKEMKEWITNTTGIHPTTNERVAPN